MFCKCTCLRKPGWPFSIMACENRLSFQRSLTKPKLETSYSLTVYLLCISHFFILNIIYFLFSFSILFIFFLSACFSFLLILHFILSIKKKKKAVPLIPKFVSSVGDQFLFLSGMSQWYAATPSIGLLFSQFYPFSFPQHPLEHPGDQRIL